MVRCALLLLLCFAGVACETSPSSVDLTGTWFVDQPRKPLARRSLELEGYTDSAGDAMYNIQLSQRRSEAVRRFLVEKGVELHRIQSIGLGDIRPSADNGTAKGREQNRRVTVRTFAPAE